MAHKFNPANRTRLESPERFALLPVARILDLAQLQTGERVLDAGCGPGVFTIPMAIAVGPRGHVTAADIEPVMIDECRARVAERGLHNVGFLTSKESRLDLPSATYDCVFACHLLHELEDPPALLAEMRRVLVPQGRLISVEWEKIEMPIGPPVAHRYTPDEADALLTAAGFDVTAREPVTWANFMLVGRPRP